MSKKPAPPSQISIPDAVIQLATKLNRLETLCGAKFKGLETKIGDHEDKFIENTPDLDRFTEMFSNFNQRFNELGDRISALERAGNVKAPKKKGGTVMLTELENTDVSFTS